MQVAAAAVVLLNVAPLLFSMHDASLPTTAERAPSSSFRLYKSRDHGASWFEVGEGLPGSRRINALAVAGQVSFAGTDEGVFISTDAGRTWSASVITPTPRVQCFAVEGRRVYAGTSSAGAFVTMDGGRSWRQVSRGLADLNIRSLATLGPIVYAGTDSRGVFVRPAGAEDWKPLGQGLPEHPQVFDLGVKGRRLYAALYSKGLYRVEAGGGRWERVGDVRPLEFLVRGDALVAGHNPGGIYRSVDDGATWRLAGGLPDGPPIWVLGDSGPNLLAGTSPGAVAFSADLGENWKLGAAGLPRGAAVVAIGDCGDYTLAAIVLSDGRRE
jgi:photosystem II stability/assembly factor-like uncharacterized protein